MNKYMLLVLIPLTMNAASSEGTSPDFKGERVFSNSEILPGVSLHFHETDPVTKFVQEYSIYMEDTALYARKSQIKKEIAHLIHLTLNDTQLSKLVGGDK